MTRALYFVCSVVFAAAPAALSAWFVSTLAGGAAVAVSASVVFALALTAAKVSLPAAFHGRAWAATGGVRGVWLSVFLLDAALVGGGMATLHATFRGPALAAHEARKAAATELDDARRALAALPPTRAPEAVAAALKVAVAATAGPCNRPPFNASHQCATVGVYEQEAAAVQIRARAAATVETAKAKLASLPEVSAYPEVARLAQFARAAGWNVDDERAAAVVALLFLVVTDVGAIVLFRLAADRSNAPPARAPRPSPAQPVALSAGAQDALAVFTAHSSGAPVAYIRNHTSGRYVLSQRKAAQALGVPQRAFAAALHELAAAGRLAVDTGPAGTFVRVLQ